MRNLLPYYGGFQCFSCLAYGTLLLLLPYYIFVVFCPIYCHIVQTLTKTDLQYTLAHLKCFCCCQHEVTNQGKRSRDRRLAVNWSVHNYCNFFYLCRTNKIWKNQWESLNVILKLKEQPSVKQLSFFLIMLCHIFQIPHHIHHLNLFSR